MKKILIIIPYFGKLPNWFNVFLNSSSTLKSIDFLLITDDKTLYKYPQNFRVVYDSFDNIKNLFKEKLGKHLYLDHPYKLCDYRGSFGLVFENFLKGYSFWAHSDIDLVWGNVDAFLDDIQIEKYDRIFPFGHFSIYRNTPEINALFQYQLPSGYPDICRFDFAKNTTYPCHFDEIGMNFIIKEKKLQFYDIRHSENVNMNYKNCAIGGGKPKIPEILVYDNGNTYTINNAGKKYDVMYFHIQSRNFDQNLDPLTNKFLITNDGFIDFDESQLDQYFDLYGANNDLTEQMQHQYQLKIRLDKKKNDKLKRELRHYKLLAFIKIFKRYKGIRYLKKNNLF